MVDLFNDRIGERDDRVRMPVHEHALHGEQVARQENEDVLIAPVGQRGHARRPTLHDTIDEWVVRVALNERPACS